MSVITESELRELWKNGHGKLPVFPPGTRFSPAANDFLKSLSVQVRPEVGARAPENPEQGIEWDKPGSFPVFLTGPLPVCLECGQPVHQKPDHLTQLDDGHFASKTNPRVILRGRIDSLHALVMLTAAIARRFELPELAKNLDTMAAYCREIMSAEYQMRPPAPFSVMGKSQDELHEISHWPDKYLGISHIVPGPQDHEIIHWLNVLRTQCREVEIVALQILPQLDAPQQIPGGGLATALNRLSSAIYVLELYFQAGKIGWNVTG